MAQFIKQIKRTHSCNQLTPKNVGEEVVLFGWVHNRRDHGGAIFIDLRDRSGLTQLVFTSNAGQEAHNLAGELRLEYAIGIRGKVKSRGANINPRLGTGEIEVHVGDLEIFNRSEPTPFPVDDNIAVNEEKRLQYRYLDLRRPVMQRTMRLRANANHIVRNYFVENGFIELETPMLVKYTPGGARNFLVPSRLNPGKFYALAESPQLFKQLCMVAGFDRYFQIVRCFRDEDLRLDRQPEFTQIDVEMSFVEQEDIFEVIEGIIARLWKELLGIELPRPFPRLPFAACMEKYGNDKPDLRFDMPHKDLTELVRASDGGGVRLLHQATQDGGIVKALRVPANDILSRSEIDKLEDVAKGMGAQGLLRAKVGEAGAWALAPWAKQIVPEFRAAINDALGAGPGDILLFQFGKPAIVHTVLANLRLHLAKKLGLIPESGSGGQWKLLWVVDPPLFEHDEEQGRFVAAHHAFTRPHDDDIPLLASEPGRVRCYRYDLVLNGFEIGGGSIRLHQPELQASVFKALGLSDEEARAKFGFLLDALKFGAPPHGGIALGMDRLVMLLADLESLREAVAFPKTQKGSDLMTGAPGEVESAQLRDLCITSSAAAIGRPVPSPTV
ncbi:MAG: aspartate--tRNA ligase [Elusimicrobia bacterium]|nr:aspartate--tRNA ligase [Elusimicrobiota bacterium]